MCMNTIKHSNNAQSRHAPCRGNFWFHALFLDFPIRMHETHVLWNVTKLSRGCQLSELINSDKIIRKENNFIPTLQQISSCIVYIPYSTNISRAINLADFAVSLQSAKIISAKMNRRLVTWLNYACNPQKIFPMKSKFWQIHEIYSPWNICIVWYMHNTGWYLLQRRYEIILFPNYFITTVNYSHLGYFFSVPTFFHF